MSRVQNPNPRPPGVGRLGVVILHVDMDAFYASVEERDQPALKGRPVVVGGDPNGRGVVAAANYVARRYGVHSAMPMRTAVSLCPDLTIVAPRHRYYGGISDQIRAIFERYTPLVEPLALDEAFLDVGGSERLFGTAAGIGQRIKEDIARELSLTASVGVATTKFVAKLASEIGKPDGFVIVEGDRTQAFLDPLPVGRLWGVGDAGRRALAAIGIATVGELRRWPLPVLRERFGRWGEHVWRLANGIDERRVIHESVAKSISHETTFARDIRDLDVLHMWLLELTEQVATRLRAHGYRARTAHVKIRYGDFTTITRAHTFSEPTNLTQEIRDCAARLLRRNLRLGHRGVRLLGLGVSGLVIGESPQASLFDDAGRERLARVDRTTDAIRQRFGAQSLQRATELRKRP